MMLTTFLARKRPCVSHRENQFNSPQKRRCEIYQRKKVQHIGIEDLICSFKKLMINDEKFLQPTRPKSTVSQLVFSRYKQKSPLNLFHTTLTSKWLLNNSLRMTVQKRFFASQTGIGHLDDKGLIREEILNQRRYFLYKHGLLQDEINYLNCQVHANYHLYSTDPREVIGLVNLNRMRDGKSPFDKEGKKMMVIHHFDQTHEGPWVILPETFHQKYDMDLHSNISLIKGVRRTQFNFERAAYWKFEANRVTEQHKKKKSASFP